MQNNNPEKIYARIRELVDESIARVTELPAADATDDALHTQREAALPHLQAYRVRVAKELNELERAAEWDVFTIAMYGETNAGKSTVIETLRILLGEPQKRHSQAEFRKLRDAHAIDAERVQALEKELQEWTAQRALRERELQALQEEQAAADARFQQEHQQLAAALQAREAQLSWWGKFVRRWRKLKEEADLAEHGELLQRAQPARAAAVALAQSRIADPAAQVRRCEQQQEAVQQALAEMAPHEDGAIIGNGRSDFTLQLQTYRFELNGRKVDLVDVPGIEGDEQKVRDAIAAAVKKVHAVFYVTRKPAPPNTGENGRPGTLEKIRAHLGSQTEVWAVYNKGIANPMALPPTDLLNEGERTSLPDLDRELRAQLGDGYQGCISLSALPAFYAVADCLLPTNSHERNRRKFLAALDPEVLLARSGFAAFVQFLQDELCRNHKTRIQRANLRKIRVILEDGAAMLKDIGQGFSDAGKNLQKQWRSVCGELDALEGSVEGAMRSRCGERLSASRAQERKEIYERIKAEIDNDEFKELMSRRIEGVKKQLAGDLQDALKEAFGEFESDVQSVVRRFHKKADEILRFNIDSSFRAGDDDVNFDFKMDSGIDTPRLLSSLGGAAALAMSIFFASNPVGWVAAAVGALGILVGAYKGLRGFFSASYRAEQQRKSADENLDRVFDALEERVKERTAEAAVEVGRHLARAKEELGAPIRAVQRNVKALQTVQAHIRHLARQLTPKEAATA